MSTRPLATYLCSFYLSSSNQAFVSTKNIWTDCKSRTSVQLDSLHNQITSCDINPKPGIVHQKGPFGLRWFHQCYGIDSATFRYRPNERLDLSSSLTIAPMTRAFLCEKYLTNTLRSTHVTFYPFSCPTNVSFSRTGTILENGNIKLYS